tara:strand:- start:5284 stop:5889 length:606 start_codon:yes stop_codon:yes gene_type:complete
MDYVLPLYTTFGKVDDIYSIDKDGLTEFLYNVVMNNNKLDEKNNNGYGIMLHDLSNIYVLVSTHLFPFNKLTTKNKNLIDLSKSGSKSVLGYIWIRPYVKTNKDSSVHFINFIDSRISGLNITKYMIRCYEELIKEKEDRLNANNILITLMPGEIQYSATKYWKQYFEDYYHIYSKEELRQLLMDYDIINDTKWECLFSIL